MKANRLFIACVSTLALAACGGGTELTATLSGGAEKPAVTTSATGSATVKIDGSKLEVSGSFTGLSGNATGAHIHGPIGSDGLGPVFCHLKYPTAPNGNIAADGATNPCSDKELTDSDVTNFEGGKMYVNIHTDNNPNGEIRGDLTKKD